MEILILTLNQQNLFQVKNYQDFLKLNQFKQYIVQITRPDSNTILDLIISNCEIVKESGPHDVNVSDHLAVYIIRKESKVIREQTTFRGRSYKNLAENELKDLLLEYDWTNFGENCIDNCWKTIYSRIDDVVNKLCPVKDFKFAKEKPKWKSDDLIELMKNKDISLKQYLKTKTEVDKKEMRRLRNMVNVAIRNARNEYVKGQLEIHQKKKKKSGNISQISCPQNLKIKILTISKRIKISKEDLPNYINTYFAKIGKYWMVILKIYP